MRKITTVLLADDDEDDGSLFAEALRDIDLSMHFEWVRNGIQILEKLKILNPEGVLIILDINMPEMNGWDALKNLKRSQVWQDIPVLMYSTSYSVRDGKKAIALGALGLYEKPSSFSKLRSFLQSIASVPIDDLPLTLQNITSDHRIYLG